MTLIYEDVYDDTPGGSGAPFPLALALLYSHLEQRTPEMNISHREMPHWHKHVEFVSSRPYKHWWLIYKDIENYWADDSADVLLEQVECIGQMYLTHNNEIGIFFTARRRNQGHGPEAVQWLIEKVRGGPFLANINPHNEASKAMFTSLGFTLIQETYILQPQFYDEPPAPRVARFDDTPFE